jgi:hypothetical protein
MSYDLKAILRGIEEEIAHMEEQDTAYLPHYSQLRRKASVLRRVIRLFERMERREVAR